MFVTKLLLLVAASSCFAYSDQESKLKLVLYYESLCGPSRYFIFNQLYPTNNLIGDSFDVEFVPWQVTNKTGSLHFDCMHGPVACFLNRIQACAAHLKPTQNQLISFVVCNLNESNPYGTDEELLVTAKDCAEKNDLSFNDLQNCVTGTTGDELLLAIDDKIENLNPILIYVPNIRFNDAYNYTLDKYATSNLTGTICNILGDDRPAACDNPN